MNAFVEGLFRTLFASRRRCDAE